MFTCKHTCLDAAKCKHIHLYTSDNIVSKDRISAALTIHILSTYYTKKFFKRFRGGKRSTISLNAIQTVSKHVQEAVTMLEDLEDHKFLAVILPN